MAARSSHVTILTQTGSFTEPSTEYLHLYNNSTQPLAFKVKTTAPKLYCVRPNASIIAPNETIKISLILQGFTQPLPKDYKCKDKFLIVSLPCPDLTDPSKVSEEWSSLEAKYPDQLLQKKLRVNFVISDDDEEANANETTFANATSTGPSAGSGSGAAGAGIAGAGAAAAGAAGLAAGHSGPSGNADVSGISRSADETINNTINGTQGEFAGNTTLNSGAGGAPAREADEKRELEASNAKINTLSEKLDSNEKAPSASTTTTTPNEEAVSGISLPFAVVLVIIALLLGWYIF